MQTPNFYNNLTDSEKRYIKVASIFFPLLLLIIGFTTYYRTITKVEQEVDSYKESLKLISVAGPGYLAQQHAQNDSVNHKKLDEEILKNNTLKLTSFIAGIAKNINLDISAYDENDVPYDAGSGKENKKIVIERTVSFDVRESELSKLLTLMEKIEESDKPVYVKHFAFNKYGSEPAIVRAKIVVATFLTSDKDAG